MNKFSKFTCQPDFLNTDISSLGIEDEDQWVSRVHKFNNHKDRKMLSGITLGKGDIMLKIYEKALELERSKNKQEVFAYLWGTFICFNSKQAR